MDSDSESTLLSLVVQLMSVYSLTDMESDLESESDSYPEVVALIIQIISFLSSMDLDLQPKPKPESKLMSLTAQAISVFTSMDLDSQPKPLSELISLISKKIFIDSESKSESDSDSDFMALVSETMEVTPEPELLSLIHQILVLVISMDSKWKNLISLCPQVQVKFDKGSFHVIEEDQSDETDEEDMWGRYTKWQCLPKYWERFGSKEKGATPFFCHGCKGKYHEEYEKAPLEIKHSLHPKHCLQLVRFEFDIDTKKCYCCDEDLRSVIYYCSACDYAMNITCAEKPPPNLSIDHRKWHEHELALFPRKASLTCDLCALADSSCPFYICPPCDFVAHQSCISLPHVIRISRHLHRIAFTPSFDRGDRSCGVCRKAINNGYGGYSCITKGCSYAAHSRCATQRNVWDGKDLENVPEEVEEELEPFVRISSGIIQHFSHEHHHMRLNEETDREYDEDKQCQACITPIYFGNFYSCMQCDFILHEDCANLSRKIPHPVHPHPLSLVTGYDGVMNFHADTCSTCNRICKAGFYYECGTKECHFRLHVQCATISEPLVHGSHIHPLFLTSKPGERRPCWVCEGSSLYNSRNTFNCIECDFALCFKCATLPQKVRYKHDKHILILSYGKEISSSMMYWCELCEKQVTSRKRFYRCDENCCVTLHIECLIGDDLYIMPGSAWFFEGRQVDVLLNKPVMSRPLCSYCERRCPHKIVLLWCGSIFCSYGCIMSKRYTKLVKLQDDCSQKMANDSADVAKQDISFQE